MDTIEYESTVKLSSYHLLDKLTRCGMIFNTEQSK